MRKAILLLSLSAFLISACAAPITVTTGAGKTAYTADQIATQVGHFEQAIITANQATPKGIPDNQAIIIVKFCVDAERILGQTPNGWMASLSVAWASTKTQIGVVTNPIIQSLMVTIDTILAVTQ